MIPAARRAPPLPYDRRLVKRIDPFKVALLAVVYASQGLSPGFATFALPVLLRREGVSLTRVGLAGLLLLPVALKFVWGPWTDRLAAAGRTRAWMSGLQIALALCVASLVFAPPGRGLVPFLSLVGVAYLVVAVLDVITDGLAVRLLTPEERPLGNAAQYGGFYAGGILAGGGFLLVEPRLGWPLAVGLLAAMVAMGWLAAGALPVPPATAGAALAGAPLTGAGVTPRASVLAFLRGPVARHVLPLLLLLDLPQNIGIALVGPALLDGGLKQERVGLVSGTAGLLAAVAGAGLGGLLLARLVRRHAIVVAGVAQALPLLGFAWLAAHRPISMPAAMAVVCLAYGTASAFNIALSSWFMDQLSPRQPSTDYSVMACAHTLTFAMAGPIAGWSAARLGFPTFFVVVGTTALLLLLLAVPWLRRLAAATLLPLALVACAATRGPAPPRGDELVVGLESAPTRLDPRLGTDQGSEYVFELVLEGLLDKRPDGSLIPGLATSWEVLDAGRRYRFHLRPDARFHDGRPLGAADVAWSYNTILDGSVKSPKRGSFGPLLRVVAVDAHIADFVLREPWGALLINLTAGTGVIPDGTSPEQMERHPIGSGPYRFVSKGSDRVELAAWDAYRGGRPPISRVVLREVPDATVRALELEKGSVQLVVNGFPPDTAALFARRRGFKVLQSPGANYVYIGLNMEDPVAGDPRVRRAIALAIDRPRLVRTVWRGQGRPTETLMPAGHWARDEALPTIPHDPAAAARLLEEAGFPDPDGPGPEPRLRLAYKVSTNDLSLLQAQAIQAMLAEAGIAAEIRSYEFATFYADVKRGSFQMFGLTWTGVAEPDLYRNLFHSASVPPLGANRCRYRNPVADRLIEEGSRRFDPRDRLPFYLELQELLQRDLPYVSLLQRDTVAVMLDGLEGYVNYPGGEMYSVRRARWRRG
jgi:peptide/nickel transport system substrate-binding protein